MTVHWLKVRSWNFSADIRKILEYVDKHQASIELYYCQTVIDGSLFIKLSCEQSYNDLDLDVNSGSSGITRLERRPRNISKSDKDIDFLKKMIYK